MEQELKDICIVEFGNDIMFELSAKRWNQIVKAGLIAYGYIKK